MNNFICLQKSVDGFQAGRYRFPAGANSSAGFDSLNHKADSRLFFVMRFFYVRNQPSCAQIMVGRNGGASRLAGFFVAGLSTLLRLTTPFDSGLVRFAKPHKEAVIMATTPHSPAFVFRFLAVRRADLNAVPHCESVTAANETAARRLLAREFVLIFCARVPAQGGAQ